MEMELETISFNEFMDLVRQGDKSVTKESFDLEYLNKTDEFGMKAIHWASLNSAVDILKWLLKNKSDIEEESKHGWRPIHFACLRHHRENIKLLVEHFCNLECKTNNNESVLDIINGKCDHEFIDQMFPETTNKKIGLTMGLACSLKCNHKFCLTSIISVKFDKGVYISNGGFGKVYRTQDSIFSRQFVLKITKKKYNDPDEKPNETDKTQLIERNINEVRQLINHPRIIKYYGGILRKEKWLIFEEYLNGGSLESELRKLNTGLPAVTIAQRCKDIIEGVIFLHQNHIIHRNLKPAKVILDKNSRCKLIMSSLSRFLKPSNSGTTENYLKTFCGTPYYMAPEIINDEKYSFPIDIWAIGATIIHMVQGQRPYFAMNTNAVIFKIGTKREIEYFHSSDFSTELGNFISATLNPIAADRPKAENLLDFEFMKNVTVGKEMEARYIDKSFEDNFQENKENCMDVINLATENKKIAIDIGLKCNPDCDHAFCLSSVSVNNFKKGELIGRGYYGNIYKVKESQTNREIAVKTFNFGSKPGFLKETIILQDKLNNFRTSIKHERLVQYYGAIRKSHKLYIFREYVEGKSIKDIIFQRPSATSKFIEESSAKRYTKHVLEALCYLHQLNIIHKNVKIGNIFITSNDNAKLADYGFCEILKILSAERERTFYGPTIHMPPEIQKDEPFDNSVDIWCLGVVINEMLTGHPPLLDFEHLMRYKIGPIKGFHCEISAEWKTIIEQMMKEKPSERATASSLLQSGFF